jgi:hypothetical protein
VNEEMQAIVLGYLERIEGKLDALMRELVEVRRREKADTRPDFPDERIDRLGALIDQFAALPPDEQRRQIERANEFLRQRMGEQPGASFMELDLSERPKH